MKPSPKTMEDCKHEIAWNGDFHINDNHPSLKDQFCMNCNKTLEQLFEQAKREMAEEIYDHHKESKCEDIMDYIKQKYLSEEKEE